MTDHKEAKVPSKLRVIALFFLGLLLLVIVEVGIGWLCGSWGDIQLGWVALVLGPVFVIGGTTLVTWSVHTQYKIGDGTPAPMVATRKLVTQGPYAYTRNPMTLGVLLLYAAIGIWMSSALLIGLVILVFASLLSFIYIHETRELAARFGDDYLDYRNSTPFLFPKFRRVPKLRKE